MVEDVCKREGGSRKSGRRREKVCRRGVNFHGGVIKLFLISKLFSSLSAAKNGHPASKILYVKN